MADHKKKIKLGWVIFGLAGWSLVRYRREITGWALGLRPPHYRVEVQRGLRITMPDGVTLVADHYRPVGEASFPTILMRTPYARGETDGPAGIMASFQARRFAERGYHVVVQDVRGRFASSGEFEPFRHEAEDGRATLAWIAAQPWFNGSLGMWGQSYVGLVQWAVAQDAPPYLKALVPAITGSRIATAGLRDGAFGMDTLLRWIYQLDAMDRTGAAETLQGWARLLPPVQERALRRAYRRLPLRELDRDLVGDEVFYYRDWLEHPVEADPYWQARQPVTDMARVTPAMHLIGGWYDIFLRETLADYTALRAAGKEPYLTVGPWYHLSVEGMVDGLRQGLDWFAAHLKGNTSRLRALPVRYYLMSGAGVEGGVWCETASWPPPNRETRYYLHPGGALAPEPPPAGAAPTVYTYDPADPTPSLGGPQMNHTGGPQDNRLLEARPDVLTFTTPPLEDDVDVTGPVRLALWVRSSQPSADFFGRLCDVHPDGRSINLCDGLARVQIEAGAEAGQAVQVDLWSTANRFRRGHCIRLQISSGAYPRWSRNLGQGAPLGESTALTAAQQTIFHDAEHPSTLVLPVRVE